MKQTSQFTWDFLRWKPIRTIVMSAAFPVALQVFALGMVAWLALNGLGIGVDMKSAELMTLRKTNLTTLVVWGLWWPSMIAVALLFGRAWCTVCPMELVNRLGHAASRKLGWPQARLTKFLRAGWVTVLLYLVLQLLVAGISIHRVPHFTSMLLLVLFSLAMITGIVFREHRSFCKAFCPAAPLLSVYGRFTPLQLETREPSVCDDCRTKDCVRASNRDRFDRRSCPSMLVPYRRNPSDGCVLCLQCAKICPHQNMSVGLVAADAPVRRRTLLRPFEAAFVMVAFGFVAHEVIGEVKWLDFIFHAIPTFLNNLLPSVPFGWFEALWFLVLFPLLVWTITVALARLSGHRAGIRTALLAAATGAAPIVAIAHLAKAIAKMTSWGGFLPLALRDPQGIDTLNRISQHSLLAPSSLLGLSVVGWVMLISLLFIALRAWRIKLDDRAESLVAARTGLVVSSLMFTSVLTVWIWPMLF